MLLQLRKLPFPPVGLFLALPVPLLCQMDSALKSIDSVLRLRKLPIRFFFALILELFREHDDLLFRLCAERCERRSVFLGICNRRSKVQLRLFLRRNFGIQLLSAGKTLLTGSKLPLQFLKASFRLPQLRFCFCERCFRLR